MTKTATIATIALVTAAVAAAAVRWLRDGGAAAPARVVALTVGRSTMGTLPASVPAGLAASVPRIAHPVPAVEALHSRAAPTLEVDLVSLLGGAAVAAMFRADDFDHRFVATVDNLGRSDAPAGVWPVNPVGGRLEVATARGGDVIRKDNGRRYAAYVRLLEQADLARAVSIYVEHYPALQREYEALGFPGRYFNDRFVAVLDQLLATPEAAAPLHVHLPRTEGAQPTRPWLLYEFDDPALRSLSAGQRLLLRMGPDDERRVKQRLMELRRLLAAG